MSTARYCYLICSNGRTGYCTGVRIEGEVKKGYFLGRKKKRDFEFSIF